MLEKIKSPGDLKYTDSLRFISAEIREKILSLVSKNGGHLASNLGVVELTVSLLKVYGDKTNSIIWDTGHQCYAYKMLTGRFDLIDTIRTKNGLSGFLNKEESKYDKMTTGHASNSISYVLGLCGSLSLNGKKIAVVGDGAITGGLAYEGLNNSIKFGKNLLVILNDNKMSISENIGFIAKYLTKLRTFDSYLSIKYKTSEALNSVPLGKFFKNFLVKSKKILKSSLIRNNIFEDMGFKYYGPIDGHDICGMIDVFEAVRNISDPVLVHIITKKGKGYGLAEKNPSAFHGVSKITDDKTESKNFSDVFGRKIYALASKNKKIYVITAAMTSCLGLEKYSLDFPERFADVGIAESHAVTFAAGLAFGGMKPFFCVYSTFLQRSIDQIIHDVIMQKLKVIFAIDRAGLIGSDGESHQGIFDVSLLNAIPEIKIYSPSFYYELDGMLEFALFDNVSAAVRYPKGSEFYKPEWQDYEGEDFEVYKNEKSPEKIVFLDDFLCSNNEIFVITYGRIFSNLAKILEEFTGKLIIAKLNVIKPLDKEIIEFAFKFNKILFFEESVKSNGVGEKFASGLMFSGYSGSFVLKSISDTFVKHAETEEQLSDFSLDYLGMKNEIIKHMELEV
ncbi:MAG: 1-deoxy-D-xylulose-5-phosphate synthase [Candidatus Improbicoccus pseudotrichonymphae]|uniref:1-deoxy-D-xylulose-5-phosphate synthase n=1 Tax=Candidatus Improbicoccus pseudotrichonymphae TaxID=3033792 RepID=A0AA48HUV9_9FIRM|nr:MAG: 1-deoxy-D-xylulose-5-phosphate synthase [Candidatus Improbicoccus pseudotrichonymphae]